MRLIRKVVFPKGAFPVKNPRTARDPSTIVNRTVTPRRPRNADLREREYLTPKEVERLACCSTSLGTATSCTRCEPSCAQTASMGSGKTDGIDALGSPTRSIL